MSKLRNKLDDRSTTEKAPFFLWVAYRTGRIGRYYSLPSELDKPDRGLSKLVELLRRTPHEWNRAILFDNQARIRRAPEEEQVLERFTPMQFGR